MNLKTHFKHHNNLLVFVISIAFLIELFISAPLWLASQRSFPMVEAFESLPLRFGATGNYVLFTLLCGALLFINLPKWRKQTTIALLIIIALFVLEDIARLQPWLYMQSAMLAVLIFYNTTKERKQIVHFLLLFIIASVYFWSGLQKINVQFITDVFPWLLEPMHLSDHFQVDTLKEYKMIEAGEIPSKFYPLLIVPAVEILMGIGLLFAKVRKIALIAAISSHLFILFVLGPFGHDWNHVVWPWNIELILLLLLLVPLKKKDEVQLNITKVVGSNLKFAPLYPILILFGLMPVFNYSGNWDFHLSGNLYCGTNNDGIFYYNGAKDDLSKTIPKEYEIIVKGSNQHIVGLDQWAIDDLKTPLYPEWRSFKRLGKKLCNCTTDRYQSGIKITTKDKFTGVSHDHIFTCRELLRE
jgi:hypothetical protein